MENPDAERHGGLCATCQFGLVAVTAVADLASSEGQVFRFCAALESPIRFVGREVIQCTRYKKARGR